MSLSTPFIHRPVGTLLLTLFTTPVIYLTFEHAAERWHARRKRKESGHVPA